MIRLSFEVVVGDFELAPTLEVPSGITVLFGPSGSGKTLTLEAIAGLLRPDSGHIVIGEKPFFDSSTGLNVPPYERRIGYLVQEYALFPHLTVGGNVAYGVHDLPRDVRETRTRQLLETLGIGDLVDRRPVDISGGQAQRTALARALAREPDVLLLDEPFAALDGGTAGTLRHELRRLARELNLTVLLVTHDLNEAYQVGDRIAVMDSGRVLQVDERDEVARRPQNARVAGLLGYSNVLRGQMLDEQHAARVETSIGLLSLSEDSRLGGGQVDLAIRSDRITLDRDPRSSGDRPNVFEVEIVDESDLGVSRILHVQVYGTKMSQASHLEIRMSDDQYKQLAVDGRRRWHMHIPPEAIHVMSL
jgi:molybdate transport system ATP-binding protein